ncbi:hypothetical protein [Amycolatopsis sp. FDAARGOS 1241]|uniref:hypothetical protein n=1 Tax=Amycolatopsis sp. FDAARGOS 1241 TaxID=2778070 RepID=UPI00351C5E00
MLIVIVIATAISRALSRDTIDTPKLRRRGVDLDCSPAARRLGGKPVAAVVEPLSQPLDTAVPLAAAAHALAVSGHGVLPVTAGSEYQGCVTARAVADAVARGPRECRRPGRAATGGDVRDQPGGRSASNSPTHPAPACPCSARDAS